MSITCLHAPRSGQLAQQHFGDWHDEPSGYDRLCYSHLSSHLSSHMSTTCLVQVNSLNNILVIGMTNRLDMIDSALLRPGRLEVQVEISLPDEHGRRQILSIHTSKMRENNVRYYIYIYMQIHIYIYTYIYINLNTTPDPLHPHLKDEGEQRALLYIYICKYVYIYIHINKYKYDARSYPSTPPR